MSHTRRDFLAGKSLRSEIEKQAAQIGDAVLDAPESEAAPVAGDTIRLTTRAMACDFSIILNADATDHIALASETLELVHELEERMSVFRDHSELSRLNRSAMDSPVPVDPSLFRVLQAACQISQDTGGAFDPTAGPLVDLWRSCRNDSRIPTPEEIERTLQHVGVEHIHFDEDAQTVAFDRPKAKLNLGAIGKGYALDQIARQLTAGGSTDWLIHGGQSTLLANGEHNGLGGWPVGIRNPLFPKQHLGTVLLKNCALSTSGSTVQFFRHQGKRYGHVLNPRAGWPVENMLSATVLAPTAAEADAFSTAFFVAGVEKALQCCHNEKNQRSLGAILIPPPLRNRKLSPVVCGIPEEVLFLIAED